MLHAGALAHPVLYGEVISDEMAWDVWVRGPGHATLLHRCLYPSTADALPELMRAGLLLNATVDTLGSGSTAGATDSQKPIAVLPPVLMSLSAAQGASNLVPVWVSKVRSASLRVV